MSTPVTGANGRARLLELDGLRALAILPVMMVHFAPESGPLKWLGPAWSAGWIGVDLFFVLSGFLITGILLDSARKPGYYRNFITRRALRILPLYYLCLLVFTAATAFSSDKRHWEALQSWGGVSWFVFYVGNIRTVMENSFVPVFSFVPLWSLQVEEQFYLLYPFLVAFCNLATLKKILTGAVIAALALRCAAVLFAPDNWLLCYVLTPTRMDSLALGGLVAVTLRTNPMALQSPLLRWACAGCAAAFLALATTVSPSEKSPLMRSIGYSIIGIGAASLLAIVLSSPKGTLSRALCWRPLVYTGQIAYGLYMLHIPAAWIARSILSHAIAIESHDSLNALIGFPAAFLAASLSWKLFESKLLSLKARTPASHPIAVPEQLAPNPS